MRIFRALLVVTILSLSFWFVMPENANAISNPSNIDIRHVRVFTSVFETGDWLITCHYDINFVTTPPESASETYTFALYDTDGTTLIATRALNAYGNNLISIWFSAVDVLTEGLVWNSAYIVKLQSNPPFVLTSTSQSLAGNYAPVASMTTERVYLSSWILSRMQIIQNEEGVTYVVTVPTGNVLNTAGTELVSLAIPGVTSILSIFQYSEGAASVTRDSTNRTYEASLMNYIDIERAESTTNWYGTALNTTWDRLEGDYAVKDIVAAPVIGTEYVTSYDPTGLIDLSSAQQIRFSIKSDRYSSNFTYARFYMYDDAGNWNYWSLNFSQGVWTTLTYNISEPQFTSGGFIPTNTANLSWSFVAIDNVTFYKILDDIRGLRSGGGIGDLTRNAFQGLGDYLGISGDALAFGFFFFVYVITASVIYFTMGNGIAAMMIALPAGMAAIYPLGVVSLAVLLVIFVVMLTILGILLFLRGM